MLIFHEGLPRAGKSYEAMVRHVIPALQKGRHVYSYVEGLETDACRARIAEAAEIPRDQVEEFLHAITRDQVADVWKHVADNSFVVLDEAQNFWPTGRQKLDAPMMQFITEHGHRGLDILLMGQDLRDVHPVWRRRVSMKVLFNKLEAVGAENRYNVTTFKAIAPEKYEKVSSSLGKYDPKYFGTYKSHVASDINTANYKDARADVTKTWWFRWGIPFVGGCLVLGAWGAWRFFHQVEPVKVPAVASPASGASRVVPAAPGVAPALPQRPFIDDLNARFRPRLAMRWERDGVMWGVIEWWDGDRLRERLTFSDVRALGGQIEVVGTSVKVSGWVATQWPREASPGALPAVSLLGGGK